MAKLTDSQAKTIVKGIVKELREASGCECGNCLFPYERFCSKCGKPNSKFDLLRFHKEMGQSVTEFLAEECAKDGHQALAQEFSDVLLEKYFCPFCGIFLEKK